MKESELRQYNERELLVQLRIAVALLESRTDMLPMLASRLDKAENDTRWMKRLMLAVAPVGSIMGGIGSQLIRLIG